MSDQEKGTLNPDILNEKVMSAIIEFRVSMEEVVHVLGLLRQLATEIPTIMAIGIATRCDENGGTELEQILEDCGYETLRAKTNIGLGRPAAVPAGVE
jgi:hypothetical protein